jgi:hypothetical protein
MNPMPTPPTHALRTDTANGQYKPLCFAVTDVGQSSAVVAEAQALAEIAEILGHTADAAMLHSHGAAMAAEISSRMWLPGACTMFI